MISPTEKFTSIAILAAYAAGLGAGHALTSNDRARYIVQAQSVASAYDDGSSVLLWRPQRGTQALVSGVHHTASPSAPSIERIAVSDFFDVVCEADATLVRSGSQLCSAADSFADHILCNDAEHFGLAYDTLTQIGALPASVFPPALISSRSDARQLAAVLRPYLQRIGNAVHATETARRVKNEQSDEIKRDLNERGVQIGRTVDVSQRKRLIKKNKKARDKALPKLQALREAVVRAESTQQTYTRALATAWVLQFPNAAALANKLKQAADAIRSRVAEAYGQALQQHLRCEQEQGLGPAAYVAAYEYAVAVFNHLDPHNKVAYAHSGRQGVTDEELANAVNKTTTEGAVMPSDSVFFERTNPTPHD